MSLKESESTVSTSYRISQETRDKIKQQVEQSGFKQKEYFEQVVKFMELDNVKKNNQFSVDTTELKDLTNRIYDIFINLCDQGNSFLNTKDTELKELRQKYKDILSDKENKIILQKQELQEVYEEIKVLQDENDKHKEEIDSIKVDSHKQLEQMEKRVTDKEVLMEAYKFNLYKFKEEIENLKSTVTKYEAYKNNNENLELVNSELEKLLDSTGVTIKNNDAKIKELNKQLEDNSNKYQEQLEQLKGQLELQKGEEILKLKQQHQEELLQQQEQSQQQKDKYNEKIEELLMRLEVKQVNNKKQ